MSEPDQQPRSASSHSESEYAQQLRKAYDSLVHDLEPIHRWHAQAILAAISELNRLARPAQEMPAVQMTDLSIEAHEGQPFKAEAHFKGEVVKLFAATAIEWFKECQGDNFVTVDLTDPNTRQRYSITMQRAGGQTPAELIAELRAARTIDEPQAERPASAPSAGSENT
ncbi:MAG: hypothetical protein ACJ8R9_05450 [Steroidobacteraceae bacterium]